MQIRTIAKGLNIYTLQGVAVSGGMFIVPDLSGQLLRIGSNGQISVLVDLLKAEVGVPFGIVENQGDLIVTVSGYLPEHRLMRVKLDGTYQEIANLSQASGFYGAPFGVAVQGKDYIVTISTDVVDSTSALVRVSEGGKLSRIANLSKYGIPFGVVVTQTGYVVAQEKGPLLRVSSEGELGVMVDLVQANLGIPLGLAREGDNFVVTTNRGLVVRVAPDGKAVAIADLMQAKLGIPSGIATYNNTLIVTTNSGYLLQLTEAS
jgi:hypothetical protein